MWVLDEDALFVAHTADVRLSPPDVVFLSAAELGEYDEFTVAAYPSPSIATVGVPPALVAVVAALIDPTAVTVAAPNTASEATVGPLAPSVMTARAAGLEDVFTVAAPSTTSTATVGPPDGLGTATVATGPDEDEKTAVGLPPENTVTVGN